MARHVLVQSLVLSGIGAIVGVALASLGGLTIPATYAQEVPAFAR